MNLGMAGKNIRPFIWRGFLQVMGNEPPGCAQAVCALVAEKLIKAHTELHCEKDSQYGCQQEQIEEKPSEYLGKERGRTIHS